MQKSKIKQGKWYQTTNGILQCIFIGKSQPKAKFAAAGASLWLSSKDVQYEIPEEDVPVPSQVQPPTVEKKRQSYSYGITADELHALIIADLKSHCKHMQMPLEMFDRIFTDNDGEAGRPLEQTIRLVVNAFAYGDVSERTGT